MKKTQALNYTPKAIEALLSYPSPGAPLTRQGFRYIADKLRQAQVFVLPDFGMLLDRSKPRPQVDTLIFKPPFDVVALEFTGDNPGRSDPYYTAARSTRRIALAWDWKDDLVFAPKGLAPGVVIASIAFYDNDQAWMPIMGAYHVPYDAKWGVPQPSAFAERMVEIGGMTAAQARAPAPGGTPIPLLPEVILHALKQVGNEGLIDLLQSDLSDEVAAYMDLCCALACRNVQFDRHAAPTKLNKARIAAGKLPLPDHHTLTLNGADYGGGATAHDRLGPRSHLRRGHIRRLPTGRITWVNQTMVHGQADGFVTKTYRIKGNP